MRKITAAYIAGLVDGEGYVSIRKDSRGFYAPVLKVALCEKDIVKWLKDSFGGSMCHRSSRGNHRESWSWEIYATKAMKVLDAIYPYLKIKHEQVKVLKKLQSTKRPENYVYQWSDLGYGRGKHKTLREDTKVFREELYQQVKSLNKRGLVQPERLSESTSQEEATV